MLRQLAVLFAASATLTAAEWTWTWQPAPGDKPAKAEVCTFKYGKTWAYAVEIDDGPKWVRSFAVPFLAEHHYSDAPPGVAGGGKRPFVGSIAAIAGSVDANDTHVDGTDLASLLASGWGVMNHSFDHRGRGWEEAGKLSDDEIRDDAWWSQALFAAVLPGGRAPTGAVYANGYTDYNRNGALAAVGITIATRVSGSSPRDVLQADGRWLDFNRAYLDDGVWTDGGKRDEPMHDFPGADGAGPAANSLVIDFTHGIDQQAGSANQERWRTRLKTIAGKWGAGGSDTLWCAPTAEVADYVFAAKAARITTAPGKLTVSLPDAMPGSALTLRISGIGAKAKLTPPEGGVVHRAGEQVYVTSPLIGQWGSPLAPRLKRIYEGPATSVTFAKPAEVAGVTIRVFGSPAAPVPYRVSATTAAGPQLIGERTLEAKWIVGTQLLPVLPGRPAITATGIELQASPEMKHMTVWAIDDGKPGAPAAAEKKPAKKK